MQFTNFATFLAIAIVGVAAAPNGGYGPHPTPPPPAKPSPPPVPVVVNQENTCSSGAPYCCSPSDTQGGKTGTTCSLNKGPRAIQCDTITICCNNNANDGTATQNCGGANVLAQPVVFKNQEL